MVPSTLDGVTDENFTACSVRCVGALRLRGIARDRSPDEGAQAGDCSDDADNDQDGLRDCEDPGCAESSDCAEPDTGDTGDSKPLPCNALVFDGVDDHVLLGDEERLIGTESAVTVAAWVKRAADTGEGVRTILDAESSSSNNLGFGAGFRLALRDGAPDFFFGAGLRTEFTLFTATDPIPEETWTHIAATRDANVVRIYVDGAVVLERLDAPTNAISYFGADYETDIYQVGQYSRAGNPEPLQHYLGSLQNLAVWSRALTGAEIAAERLSPGATTLDRVGWWSFTEGTGVVAANLDETTGDADLLPADSPPTWTEDCPSP